jgi:hypothetical protein
MLPMQNAGLWARIGFYADFIERRIMSLLEWAPNPVAQFKKYADLGQICIQDVSRFDECEQVGRSSASSSALLVC